MARKPKSELVNGSELARRLGVSRNAIAKAKREGRITPTDDGLYDVGPATEAFLGSRSRPPRSETEEAPRQTSDKKRADWSALREREQYLKLRLERRELQGALVRRQVVEAEFAELATLIRDRFRSLGKRLRDRLAAEVDARKVGETIDAAVDAILHELATSRRDG